MFSDSTTDIYIFVSILYPFENREERFGCLFTKFVTQFSPTEITGVDPRAASNKSAISRTEEGRGGAPRESIERIHFWRDSSSISVNFEQFGRVSERFVRPLSRFRKEEKGTAK